MLLAVDVLSAVVMMMMMTVAGVVSGRRFGDLGPASKRAGVTGQRNGTKERY